MARRKTRKAPRSRTAMAAWLTVMLLFFGELFAYTWCRVENVRTGYEITNARQEQKRLLVLREKLRIEKAALKSPERITRIARTKLGLTMPDPSRTIVIP